MGNQTKSKKDIYAECEFSQRYVDELVKQLCENKGQGKYALTKYAL